ncbi:hypothetical protein GCM10011613_17830 [Cellvibrio zantedeschiae]|uniref:Uncharacterized protein n=1 Tax=Cellvibrio zantedeschiae TaxID=1237077 RepID=A0ABQ3B0N1_9GAMM|nr:hypothetical protein GCM10011613_17830 [Cellvibrio zantedeschiae]
MSYQIPEVRSLRSPSNLLFISRPMEDELEDLDELENDELKIEEESENWLDKLRLE